MGTNKMKGLLKGLRYISNIFEAEEKEPEMQIGFPTDVKHVAHIGWDGLSMNDLKPGSSEPLTGMATGERKGTAISPKSPSQDTHLNGGARGSSSRDLTALPLPKPSKRNPSATPAAATGSNPDSPGTRRHSRRNQSSSVSSPDHEKPDGSRRGRRERHAAAGGSDISNDTSTALQDQPASASKQTRRRKVKGSSSSSGSGSGGSSKPLRSKAIDGRAAEQHLPPLKPTREDEEEDEG